MKITKKDGSQQAFMPNKILNRIKTQSSGLKVNPDELFQEVIPYIQDGMTTTDIDEIIAYKAADRIVKHPDYSLLGGRILLTRQAKLLNTETKPVDLTYDFFAADTFLRKYSMKDDDKTPLELPHMMYERVARHLYPEGGSDHDELLDELYSKRGNFATPTYTNIGIPERGSMISCNLTHLKGDSLEDIEETMTMIAKASKEGSGIGLMIDPIRSKKSLVGAFKENAAGVVRLADKVQAQMRFYKQGSRSGSCALYLSVWHKDILPFLELRLPIGAEEERTRDLFLAVTVNDLFMRKLKANEDWYLFCPNDIKKAGLRPLYELWGDEFEIEYQKAVDMGLGEKIEPKKVFDAIIRSQVETGTPYVFFKDNANRKNMQSNIGTIVSSNLCIEIMEVSKPQYTAQCTLASVNLAQHDDLESIAKTTRILTKALNRVIDTNKWSDEWSRDGGLDQRALAIGVAGMADFFARKKVSFESEEAKQWNADICETMYKSALTQSMELAVESGRTYPSWEGSPYSKGKTYIDGWSPLPEGQPIPVMNSLFLAFMPTASSATLLGSFESFEPANSPIFTRRVAHGEFSIVNKYLVDELDEIGLWNEDTLNKLIVNGGSIQNIMEIPSDIRHRYKGVFDIPQKTLLELAIIRQKYIDQSQSLNVYHADHRYSKLASALNYAWEGGLKTGVYYTRVNSKLEANIKLAVQSAVQQKEQPKIECFGCEA